MKKQIIFNRPAAIKEIRSTNNRLQKAPGPNGFVDEHLYQILKEEIKLLRQCQQTKHRNLFLPHTTLTSSNTKPNTDCNK